MPSSCFFKHSNLQLAAQLDAKHEEIYRLAITNGTITEKEREATLLRDNLWSQEKETEIDQTKFYIDGLNRNKNKQLFEWQITQINNEIAKHEKKLNELLIEKDYLMGLTAEKFTKQKVNEYYLFISLFKDQNLTVPLFTTEDFDRLDDLIIENLFAIIRFIIDYFDDVNLKKLALNPLFLNYFSICNSDPSALYGKPVIDLSFYQIEIFGYGSYYKNLLSNSDISPPEDVMDDPDKFEGWFKARTNAQELLQKKGGNLVGASSKDLQRLGLQGNTDVNKIIEKARQQGGQLHGVQNIF